MRRARWNGPLAVAGVLAVIGAVVGLLIATGRILPSAVDEHIEVLPGDRFAGIDTARIRDGLQAMGLTDVPENVIATLSTLKKIDDYPVYTMRYFGPYLRASELREPAESGSTAPVVVGDLACSLFAAGGETSCPVFGRNFDWEYSPLLVLLLEPDAGLRSVMSVDIAYLIEPDVIDRLDSCPAERLLPLLDAPFLTFDGMNEAGLAIGMASVDYDCGYPAEPGKRDVGDLRLMRELLEGCATTDEAIAFLEGINPVSQGGPNMHYLVADRTGAAALVEYDSGRMFVFRSTVERPWHLGTNFPVVLAEGDATGRCWRYDLIERSLRENDGRLSGAEAMDLLASVSTPMTRWSIVYELGTLEMSLAIERAVESILRFSIDADAR